MSQAPLQNHDDTPWFDRITGNYDAARAAVLDRSSNFGIGVQDWTIDDNTQLMDQVHAPDFLAKLELVLLKLSLLRTVARCDEFHLLSDDLSRKLELVFTPTSFWYWHERALSFYLRGDYCNASEAWTISEPLAQQNWQRVIAAVNLTLCNENLGLDVSAKLRKAEGNLQGREVKDRFYETHQEILDLVELRRRFRAGIRLPHRESANQRVRYYQAWISALPFRSEWQATPGSDVHFDALFLNKFRTRTLLGVAHPDDHHIARPSEFIERFYLWTWWLITNCKPMDIDSLGLQLEAILSSQTSFRCHEDRAQLRNALAWLSLFNPNMEFFINLISGPKTSYAQYDAEHAVINVWRLKIKGADKSALNEIKRLKGQKPNKQSALKPLLSLIQERPTVPHMATLHEQLKKLTQTAHPKKLLQDGVAVVVDTPTERILTSQGVTVSRPLSIFFRFLANRELAALPIKDLFTACFEMPYRYYDSHDAKIYNLVARAKKFLPQRDKLWLRNGFLHYEASGSRTIALIVPNTLAQEIDESKVWARLFQQGSYITRDLRDRTSQTSSLLKRLRTSESDRFTRFDVEKLSSASRSTCNRILKRLCQKGYVEAQGQGKARTYTLTSKGLSLC